MEVQIATLDENSENGSALSADLDLSDLDADSPEMSLLRYIQSLGREELVSFRREICLSGLKHINGYFAQVEAS